MKDAYQHRGARTSATPLCSNSKDSEQLNSEVGYDDSVSHFPTGSSRHWSIIMSSIHLTLSSKKPWDTT